MSGWMQLDKESLPFLVRDLVPVNPITRPRCTQSDEELLQSHVREGRLLTLMWSSSLRSFAFSSRSARSKGNPGYRRESWRDKRNESLFVRSGFSNVSCTFTSDSSIEYRRLSFSIALRRSCISTRPNRSSAVKMTKTSHTSFHTSHDGLQG